MDILKNSIELRLKFIKTLIKNESPKLKTKFLYLYENIQKLWININYEDTKYIIYLSSFFRKSDILNYHVNILESDIHTLYQDWSREQNSKIKDLEKEILKTSSEEYNLTNFEIPNSLYFRIHIYENF